MLLGIGKILAPTTKNDGSWHHIVGTYDGTTVRLYVDGAEVTNSALSGGVVNSGSGARLKLALFSGSATLQGSIDEVAIYRAALSAAQVLAHYNAGLAVPPSVSTARTRTLAATRTMSISRSVAMSRSRAIFFAVPAVQLSSVAFSRSRATSMIGTGGASTLIRSAALSRARTSVLTAGIAGGTMTRSLVLLRTRTLRQDWPLSAGWGVGWD